jgi:recombination protein RecA
MASVKELFTQFNKGGVQVAFIGRSMDAISRMPTGVFQFDLATGGGVPEGRISLFYGPESSAKTTMALKVIAQCQRRYPDKQAVFIDAEGHFDAIWAKKQGVDVENLGYIMPTSAEHIVDLCEGLIQAEDISCLVVDSLAAMITQRELDSDAEKQQVGSAGLAVNKLYRKTGHALNQAALAGRKPTIILINQIRFKVGVMYGDPETMPGGPSFKFASSLTCRFYGKDIIDKDVHTSLPAFKEIKCIIKKQKVGIIAANCEFQMAILPNPSKNLKVGQTYEWNTVLHYLKALGWISKPDKTWDLVWPDTGEIKSYKTQNLLYDEMKSDPQMSMRLKGLIFDELVKQTHEEEPDGEQLPETTEEEGSFGVQGANSGEADWEDPED